MTLSVVTLILAGGQSSRMGTDKALLPIQGVPLIRRIYDVVKPCCASVYVVSPWGDRYRSVLPPACQFLPEELSANEKQVSQQSLGKKQSPAFYTHGPLIGFYQGLSQLISISHSTTTDQDVMPQWVLLLACDLPNLQTDVIQEWCDRLNHCSPSTMALLPNHSTKGWHPLCGFYRYRCLPSLERFIEQGGQSFQKWLVNEEVRSLSVSNPSLLFNCNTPEDVRRLTHE